MTDTSNSTPATSAGKPAETPFKFQGDFRAWNAMSSHMRGFHNYFKYEFDNIYRVRVRSSPTLTLPACRWRLQG